MDDLLYQMGMRILTRRKQMRLTQEELAAQANVTPQTISSAELGKKALRPENIVSICLALDITTDYLLLGKHEKSLSFSENQKIQKLNKDQLFYLEKIIACYLKAIEAT